MTEKERNLLYGGEGRLRLRQNMPYKDEVRSSNCAMACNLMFLYSQYRLIGITHQQVISPLTFEEGFHGNRELNREIKSKAANYFAGFYYLCSIK